MAIDKRRLALLLLAVPPLLWSTNFVAGRALADVMPPIGWAFWRWTVATLVLLPFAIGPLWQHRAVALRAWPLLLGYGITGIAVYNTFVYIGLHSTTATNAGLLNAAIPVFIPLVAFLLAGEKLRWAQATGIAVSLAGVVWIVVQGDLATLASLTFTAGDLWVIAANLDWAVYSVLLRWRPRELPPTAMLLVATTIGSLVLLPFYLAEHLSGTPMPIEPLPIAVIIYVGIGPSLLAYVAWNANVARFGATAAGLSIHLMPVFIPLLAALLLGERFRLYHAVGVVLVFAGIAIATRQQRSQGGGDPGRAVSGAGGRRAG